MLTPVCINHNSRWTGPCSTFWFSHDSLVASDWNSKLHLLKQNRISSVYYWVGQGQSQRLSESGTLSCLASLCLCLSVSLSLSFSFSHISGLISESAFFSYSRQTLSQSQCWGLRRFRLSSLLATKGKKKLQLKIVPGWVLAGPSDV